MTLVVLVTLAVAFFGSLLWERHKERAALTRVRRIADEMDRLDKELVRLPKDDPRRGSVQQRLGQIRRELLAPTRSA